MIGGAVMVVVAFVYGSFANTAGTIAGILWAAGSIAGLVGLIQLGALGESPVTRALGFVPILGFALIIVGSVLQLAGIVDDQSWLFGVGFMVQLAGMVLVAILVIAAKRWRGWRRFAPLLAILLVPVGYGLGQALGGGVNDLAIGVKYAAWILLGYAVATASPTTATSQPAAA
jgi:hypothetical protein